MDERYLKADKSHQKIVHKKFLEYFFTNDIEIPSFFARESTQIAIFELLKQVYSLINNMKIFGSIFLDVSKAFGCIKDRHQWFAAILVKS